MYDRRVSTSVRVRIRVGVRLGVSSVRFVSVSVRDRPWLSRVPTDHRGVWEEVPREDLLNREPKVGTQ